MKRTHLSTHIGNAITSGAVNRQLPRKFLAASIFATGIVPILSLGQLHADQLTTYTFGPNGSTPGTLVPTTVAPNLTATSISADAGLLLDLTNPATAPASSPYLRTTFTVVSTTQAAAFSNNADFKFTLTADAGYLLNLASLAFDAMRGGAGTPRGYAVRSSVDGFSSVLATADIPSVRPNLTPVFLDLSGPAFQGLSSITFKIYSYSPGTGSSVDYDSFVVNGTTSVIPTTGYTWVGLAGGANWDTTSANWTGLGTLYPDATPGSNVFFPDSAATGSVLVSPASLAPNSITFDNASLPYTLSGSSLTVTSSIIKNGAADTTISNTVSAATVTANAGNLIIGPGALLTAPVINVATGGTVTVQVGGAVGATSGLLINGNVALNNATQVVNSLNGLATGVLALNGTALEVTGGGSYSGSITGSGPLLKSTGGTQALAGTGSSFSGGTTVTGGALELNSAQAAGTGAVSVIGNGVLNLGAAVANAIALQDGATLGVSAAATTPANITVTGNTTVKTLNAASNGGSFDLIMTGQLLGAGNISLISNNGNAPDNQAFRLRGPVSDYSGTITVAQSAKLELQTGLTSGSPMGTGKLVMTAGAFANNLNGSYSLLNLRNNSALAGIISDTTFGNNIEVIGAGSVVFNMLGTVAAGSLTRMGSLTIGDGQSIVAASTAGGGLTLAFTDVKLTGGNATFVPQPIGNANFIAPHNISLGPITESVAGSGIIMNGAATLTLTGANTFTGPTALLSGITVLAAGATLSTSSGITVANGASLNPADGSLAVLAAQTLTLNGTLNGGVALSGTLRGSGTLNGTVTAATGSLVAPGNSAALLSTGNVNLGAGSTFEIELSKAFAGAPIAGSDYDVLSVSDTSFGATPTVTLGATLDLVVGSGIEMNDIFTIIVNNGGDAVVGTFAGLPNGATFSDGGQTFQISYADDKATAAFELTGGNDVSLLAVPEPSAALLMLGGLGLVGMRRRRR